MKLSSKIIAKILVLCGISLTCTACYGIPQGREYMTDIEGMVTDEATGRPVEGIKVTGKESASVYSESDMLSDGQGTYSFKVRSFSPPPMTIIITAEDIDGLEHGEYATLTKEIELVDKNFAPAGTYDDWQAKAKVSFELSPKSREEIKPAENDENE